MDFLKALLAYMATTLVVAVESTSTPSVTPVPTPAPTLEPGTAVVETTAGLPSMEETAVPTATVSLTPPPVPTITPNMKGYHNLGQGDRGEEVKKLQERLIELGYLPEGAADGAYGGQTRLAVRRFQYFNGLTVDGIAGRATQTNLFENPDAAPYPDQTTPTPEVPETTPAAPEESDEAGTDEAGTDEAAADEAAAETAGTAGAAEAALTQASGEETAETAETAAAPEAEEQPAEEPVKEAAEAAPAEEAAEAAETAAEAATEPAQEVAEAVEEAATEEAAGTAKTAEETKEAEQPAEEPVKEEAESAPAEEAAKAAETAAEAAEETEAPAAEEAAETAEETKTDEQPAEEPVKEAAEAAPAEEADETAEAAETPAPAEMVEEVNLDEQEATPVPPSPTPEVKIVYEDLAGWVALNESGDALQWTELVDGVPVVRSPRLQRHEDDIRISLDDLCKSVMGWTLTEDGENSLVLEAQGFVLALLNEDAGFVSMVDGLEMYTEARDFDFGEGHFIRVDFLTRALDGEWEWDAEEDTLIIRIPQKNPELYSD